MADNLKSESGSRPRRDRSENEEFDEESLAGDEPKPGQDVPVTGGNYAVTEGPIEQVNMSDLVDPSDAEDMEEFADHLAPGDLPEVVDTDAEEMAKYTRDQDVLDDLAERQQMPASGEQLLETLKNYTSESPDLTGEDIDADWEGDNQSGEESVGGSVATPEQNVVGELGEAVGIEYNDFEPLDTEDKIDERDKNRWELNPESTDPDETMVAYDKNKLKDEEDGNYSKVDNDFSALMNDETENAVELEGEDDDEVYLEDLEDDYDDDDDDDE